MTVKVLLDCNSINDWESFHEEFSRAFGFPAFYGRNMNAWIDCLTSLDAPDDGMSAVHCEPGAVVTLELKNVKAFAIRCSRSVRLSLLVDLPHGLTSKLALGASRPEEDGAQATGPKKPGFVIATLFNTLGPDKNSK